MNAACDAHFQFGWRLGWTMVDAFSWTTPTIPAWETNIRDKNKHVCNLVFWVGIKTAIGSSIIKAIINLSPKKNAMQQFFGSHPSYVSTFPGVVCHPIFASFLSYVAELEMEGDGIWDWWSHGPWSPWSIIPKDPPFWSRLKIPKVNHWRSQKSINDPNTYHGCSCTTISVILYSCFFFAIDRWQKTHSLLKDGPHCYLMSDFCKSMEWRFV